MRCCGPRGSGRGRAEGLGGRGASGQPRTAGALGGPWVGAGAQLRRLTARDGAAGRSGEDRARQDPGGRPSSHGSRSSHGGRTAGAAGGGARPRPPVPCTPVQGLGRVDQSWRLAPQPPTPPAASRSSCPEVLPAARGFRLLDPQPPRAPPLSPDPVRVPPPLPACTLISALHPTEKSKDRGSNTIGARLHRVEDKVGPAGGVARPRAAWR